MSTNVKQCKHCRRLFQSLGSDVCPICADELDRYFITVKEYLYSHPDADLPETARETGVPEKIVLSFLREGRLSATGSDLLECEECGAPIPSGRFCADCQNRLEQMLSSAYRPEEKPDARKASARMHVNYRK